MNDKPKNLLNIPISTDMAIALLKSVDSTAGKEFKKIVWDIVAKTLGDIAK